MLQAAGHDVFTPTLTGVADRLHLLTRDVNLDTHIQDVVNLITWEELTDVVLCGHSYGGCVVTGVADRIPERIRSLVYLDAFVPDDGQSNFDLLTPLLATRLSEGTHQLGDGWQTPPVPAAVFNVNAADREWVDRLCTVHPYAAIAQPIRLTGGIERVANRSYILATGWNGASPFPPLYERARARGWKTSTVPCGHDVMLDLPEVLTAALIEAI